MDPHAVIARARSGIFSFEACAAYRDCVRDVVTSTVQRVHYEARHASSASSVGDRFRRGLDAILTLPNGVFATLCTEATTRHPALAALHNFTSLVFSKEVFRAQSGVVVDLPTALRTMLKMAAQDDAMRSGEYLLRMSDIEKDCLIETIIRRSMLHDQSRYRAAGSVAPVVPQPVPPPGVVEQPASPPGVVEQPAPPPAVVEQPVPPPAVVQQPAPPAEPGIEVLPIVTTAAAIASTTTAAPESVASGWGSEKAATVISEASTFDVLSHMHRNAAHGVGMPEPTADTHTPSKVDSLNLAPSDITFTEEIRRKLGDGPTDLSAVAPDESVSQIL